MKSNRITKKEMEELKAAYRFKCRLRYRIILSGYTYDFLSKVYAVAIPLLVLCDLLPMKVLLWTTPIAVTGFVTDYIMKWYQLKHMKFRTRKFFKKGRG
jgi:hypothetical protein